MLSLMTVFIFFLVPFLAVILYYLCYWKFGMLVSEKTRVWFSPYECGFLGSTLAENVFSYTYFMLMVFFVVFDLEMSLLMNIPFQGVMYKNFFFYLFFIVVLLFSYLFEVGKGYVSWNY